MNHLVEDRECVLFNKNVFTLIEKNYENYKKSTVFRLSQVPERKSAEHVSLVF